VSIDLATNVFVSTDGTQWTGQRARTRSRLSLGAIAYGGGKFVAVGAGGVCMTSLDGKTWSTDDLPAIDALQGVAFGNDTFVAVGEYGTVSSSSVNNGVLEPWSRKIFVGTGNQLYDVTYGKGTFVAVGELGTILQSDLVAQPRLDLRLLSDSGFGLGVQGEIGVRYRIQATPDFAAWVDVGAITNTTPSTVFTDSMNALPQRFYRVVSP